MTETHRDRHLQREPEGSGIRKEHRPYWRRAHQEWRFWLALMLMIVAMGVYVMTEDLSIRPQQPIPGNGR